MSLKNKDLTMSVTNRILVMKFLSEFIVIYPLITIMYGSRGHVDGAGIGVILAVGLALAVIFEIPTGIIADKVHRKFILMASIIAKILSFIIWLLMPNFRGYLMAATLMALSLALESGALQAYLYSVLGEGNKNNFGKFWARVSAMIMVSYTLAYIMTSLIGVDYPLLIILSIVPCIAALVICSGLPVDTLEVDHSPDKVKILSQALKHIKLSPDLMKLITGGVIAVALSQVMIEYLSLYYKQVGVMTRYIPIIMAVGNLLGALLFWSFSKWEKWFNRYKLPAIIFASAVFGLSFMGGVVGAVLGVLLFTRFVRILQVQYESNLQHLANDSTRATVASIGSFASSIIGSLIFISIGFASVGNIIVKPLRLAMLFGMVGYLAYSILINRASLSKTVSKN